MPYKVTAPLVVSTDDEGRQHYAYQGQQLPDFVKGDQLKRFKDEGLVEETKAESADESKASTKSSPKK